MTVILAQPRSFYAGMVGGLTPVAPAPEEYRPPVGVCDAIVREARPVERRKAQGPRLVENLTEILCRPAAVSQGVSYTLETKVADLGLSVLDAACLPSEVHFYDEDRVRQQSLAWRGRAVHPKVAGTLGCIPGPVHPVPSKEDAAALKLARDMLAAYVTQARGSVDHYGAQTAVF
ncbi:MAG: hypothetical protein ACREC1_09390 [Methylovirgula sp.]